MTEDQYSMRSGDYDAGGFRHVWIGLCHDANLNGSNAGAQSGLVPEMVYPPGITAGGLWRVSA